MRLSARKPKTGSTANNIVDNDDGSVVVACRNCEHARLAVPKAKKAKPV
jgi:hypothetical protein